ncbi:MAG: ArnT family glycosyltransferase, partial [Longimicrobiales bacterium]
RRGGTVKSGVCGADPSRNDPWGLDGHGALLPQDALLPLIESARPGIAPTRRSPAWRRAGILLAAILLVSGGAMTLAMRRTSTTFDEIILIAGGAHGYETGDWSIAPEHPPLTQYLYGLLPFLSGPTYPDEFAFEMERYSYSRILFFGSGNDPEVLAFLGRLPGVVCALALVFLVFAFTRRHFGDAAGVLAAAIVAFLPDVLAHSGVAYNDVPVTLAIFAAVWLADNAVRRPTLYRGAAFGIVAGLALGTKNSAVALAPIVLLLLAAEAIVRRAERNWLKRLPLAIGAALITTYLAIVLVYRGDFLLSEYRYALDFVFGQVTEPEYPSYLLGRTTVGGWWYYFPVAFLFKTSAGLHVLLALGAIHSATRLREAESFRRLLQSRLRVPLMTLVTFVPLLLTSELNIGFRYAMPVLPMLGVLGGVSAVGVWHANWRRARLVIGAATACLIVHPLSYFPNFLTYISEYGPGRDRNYTVLVDSSMDWGQGLIQLRDFMRQHEIPSVYLGYFGTAVPAAYGIDYVPLPSFPMLPPAPTGAPPLRYIVISATNLAGGGYFAAADPYYRFREREPAYVIGNTLYVFNIQ